MTQSCIALKCARREWDYFWPSMARLTRQDLSLKNGFLSRIDLSHVSPSASGRSMFGDATVRAGCSIDTLDIRQRSDTWAGTCGLGERVQHDRIVAASAQRVPRLQRDVVL